MRGDRQVVSETVGNVYGTVGEFDGQAGTTTVECRFAPPKDLLGTLLILRGTAWRKARMS